MVHLFLLAYHFEYTDLIPYILFVAVLLITSNLKLPVKRKIIYMAIELLLFTCLRYDIGYDYPAYKEAILGLNDHEYERFEFLNRIIVDLTRFIGEYQLFFIICSLLTYIPLTWFCFKLSRDSILSFLIYIFYPYMFFESMSAIRNFIAFSVIMIALHQLIRAKTWMALLFIIFAFGFHKSALIALLIIPLFKLRIKYAFIICIWLISFVGSFILEDLFSGMESDVRMIQLFLNSVSMQWSGGKTMTYLVNIIGVIAIIYWNKIKSLRKENEGLLNIFIFGIVIWNLLAFDFVSRSRLSMYFLITLLLLAPEMEFMYVKYKKVVRKLIFMFFFAVFISSFIININGNLEKGIKISFLPYQTIFSHVDYDRDEI